MTNIEILKNHIENNNGILLSSELTNMHIHRQYITILCNENYIERVGKGTYVKKEKNVNDFFLLQQRYKTGIFSHNTAIYFYNLTDRTPQKYDLTFKSKTRVHDKTINAHYIKNELFEIGLTDFQFKDGTSVKCYDIERTIIDILRDRNKMDIQIFNTAIKEYMKRKDKNLAKLGKYSKIFNVDNIFKKYMEVL